MRDRNGHYICRRKGVYSIDRTNAVWATDRMHKDYQEAGIHINDVDKKISIITRKFYDPLHYLKLIDKEKPVQYVYVLEYPNGDATTRKRLRNRLKTELPFALQEDIGNGNKLIDKVEVVSIGEWDDDSIYGN